MDVGMLSDHIGQQGSQASMSGGRRKHTRAAWSMVECELVRLQLQMVKSSVDARPMRAREAGGGGWQQRDLLFP